MSYDNTQPPLPPQGPAVPPPPPGAYGAPATTGYAQPPASDGYAPAAPHTPAAPGGDPNGKPKRNVVAIIALVAAALGFIFAIVPGAFALGWLLLGVGFVLAIVSLFMKGTKKTLGIWALILSVVGSIVGGIVFAVTAISIVGDAIDVASGVTVSAPAEDESVSDESTAPAEEATAAEESAEDGTRGNPYPIGTEISGNEWTVAVNSVTLGATDAVLAANEFNEAPAEGSEYILVNVTTTYTGTDSGMPIFVQVEYVTPDGVTVTSSDTFVVGPDALDITTELYEGASASGNVVLAIPSADAAAGVIAVTPGMFADTVFVAVQ